MTSDPPLPGKTIDLPLPPELSEAFGYSGPDRFVAFYWTPAGDDMVYEDGRRSGMGSSWTFLTYRRHPAVAPLLEGWNLGYSDADAEHCLLLDRQKNRVRIAPLGEARTFLQAQHPPASQLTTEQAEALRLQLREILDRGIQNRQANPPGIFQIMDEQRQRVSRMRSWLDQCPIPPQAERDFDGP